MELGSVFVTGANRGIGLEFVRQLVSLPKPPQYVFATYRDRDSAMELKSLREASKECQVFLIKMDVRNPTQVEAAAKIARDMLGEKGLNLLINNAGMVKLEAFPDISDENMLAHFHTNTLGPMAVLKALLPLLQRAADNKSTGLNASRAAILNISSMLGSIASMDERQYKRIVTFPQTIGYSVSKAALNMAMRIVALQVKDKGILVVNMCPGWVRTDMGSEAAHLEPAESIAAMLRTLAILNEKHHGTFLNRFGEPIEF